MQKVPGQTVESRTWASNLACSPLRKRSSEGGLPAPLAPPRESSSAVPVAVPSGSALAWLAAAIRAASSWRSTCSSEV